MKIIKLITAFLSIAIIVGCSKSEPISNSHSNPQSMSYRNSTTTDMEIGERVNGLIICTIDEDILDNAIRSYYGGNIQSSKMRMVEKNSGLLLIKGTVRKNNGKRIKYAFECIEFNGKIYLPVVGHAQHCKSLTPVHKCKLKVTSASTGYCDCDCPAPSNAVCRHKVTFSADNTATKGTYGLILKILEEQQNAASL